VVLVGGSAELTVAWVTLTASLHTATSIDLNDIPYAEGVRFTAKRGCLHLTRQKILADILSLLNGTEQDTRSRAVLLTGTAGIGKSAIARTIAEHFDEQKRLGSSFFFDRLNDAKNRTNNVFSTVARDTADLDPRIRENLWDVIKDNRSLRKSHSPREQFEHLILSPTEGLKVVGPIVIVIDAIDECGNDESRKEVLDVLATQIQKLPDNIRFLLTARPDADIVRTLGSLNFVHHIRMENVDSRSTKMDIRAFIQEELSDIVQKPRSECPDKQSLDALAELADELFIWASTACRFIQGHGEGGGRSPGERMALLLHDGPQKLKGIDDLYLAVLRSAFKQDDAVVMNRFKVVMSIILAAKVPLSVVALSDLFEDDDILRTGTESVIPHLGSLLSGTTAQDVPLQILHISFGDFLADVSRSQGFCINFQELNEKFAMACLTIMDRHLKRDLCAVGNRLMPNSEITGVQGRIEDYAALKYACCFFASHVTNVPVPTVTILDIVFAPFLRVFQWIQAAVFSRLLADQHCQQFLQGIFPQFCRVNFRTDFLRDRVCTFLSGHVLHWIEALSLMGQLDIAAGSVERLEEWLKVL